MFASAHYLLVYNDTEKSRVDLPAAVVLDESELSNLVHEKVHRERVVPTRVSVCAPFSGLHETSAS